MSAPATAVTGGDDSRYYTYPPIGQLLPDYRLPLAGEELLPVLQAVTATAGQAA
jgi:hypothetical protein